MSPISSSITVLLVSLLNNDPASVHKYIDETTIQTPVVKVGHSLEDLQELQQRDVKLHALSELVSDLTSESEKIMHLIAVLDAKDFSNPEISKSLKELYSKTKKVLAVSESRFKNTDGAFKAEHEKVLYYTTVLNTFVFALIDEDLQEITEFKRTVPEDIFTTGKKLYAMDVRAQGLFVL